jgi:predicted nucleic acid-binding protein
VYDSLYIALAQRIQAPMITLDTRQMQVAQIEGITLKSILDF